MTEPTTAQFFSSQNETMLDRLLYSDFKRRLGGDLNTRQRERLVKTVRHYMNEVHTKKGDQPIQAQNKEVLLAVVPDFMGYLRRTNGPTVAEETTEMNGPDSPLQMDVNSRFDQLQQDRQSAGKAPPAAPDFRISLDKDGPTSLSRFEELKKIREQEAMRVAEATATMAAIRNGEASVAQANITKQLALMDTPLGGLIESDKEFKMSQESSRQRDEAAVSARFAERSAAAATMASQRNEIIPPDPRRILLGDSMTLPARGLGIASANPTLALTDGIRDRPALPQDILKPQEDIVSYRENEYNLFVYSADRDWVNNSIENRYNFSVNFDPANNRPGFGFSTATNIKFKNITRIEFVKAIMPVEACDIQIQSTAAVTGGATEPTMNTALTTGNTFSFPYVQVRIPELNTNGYGTNDGLNNAFATISYDAYWSSESATGINKGYTRLIPKFMKCQKVFYPTPLATLQKLSFEIQRPDGTPLCSSLDTLDVSGFYISDNVSVTSKYYDGSGIFIWISMKSYFNRFAFGSGDRVQLKNVDFSTAFKTGAGSAATNDFTNFINKADGHLILDIGRVENISGTLSFRDGPNVVGYANAIIIRGNFNDPTTGSTALRNYGGTSATNLTFETQLASTPTALTGRLINLSHQVQIILRVITRDMDSAARLRPDNLQA